MNLYDIELPEKAKKEMQSLLNAFKEEAVKSLEKSLSEIYCDIGLHIETDSWINYRNQLQQATENDGEWNRESVFGKKVRATILKQNKEELIALLNQDSLKEIEELKADIERLNRWNNRSY